MARLKQKINPRTCQFNLIPTDTVLVFKAGVADEASLPTSGNTENDARITADNSHLYVWSGTEWVDQGDILDVDWAALTNKPSSAVGDIDDAVSEKHTQDTDQTLDDGGANEVSASEIRIDLDSFKVTQSGDLTINISPGKIRYSMGNQGVNAVDDYVGATDLALSEGDGSYNVYYNPSTTTVVADITGYNVNRDMLIAAITVDSGVIIGIIDERTKYNFFAIDGITLQVNTDGLLKVVDDSHIHTKLDEGGTNEVSALNLKSTSDKIVKPFEVVATSIETETITIGTGTLGDETVIAEETFSLVSDEGSWNIYIDNASILTCVHVESSVFPFPVDSIPLYRVEFANHGPMHSITPTDVRCFYNLKTIPLNGVIDPTLITPDYIGQIYINTSPASANTGFFFAYGIAEGNWTQL